MNSRVKLWIKSDSFSFGIFPVKAEIISIKFLKRIISYVKRKKHLGFPKLSYSVWKHIACSKLQLPEEIAWLYFATYHSLTKIKPADRIQWDLQYATCPSDHIDDLKNITSVDMAKFLLMLYLQSFNEVISQSDSNNVVTFEFKCRKKDASSCSADQKRNKGEKVIGKNLDENDYLSFVEKNLKEILLLLAMFKDDFQSKENVLTISKELLSALNFIFEGTLDGKTIVTAENVILHHKKECGFITAENTFSFHKLMRWIKSMLCVNPYGVISCTSTGRRLSWPTVKEKKPLLKGQIITNAMYAPKGRKLFIISHIDNQTISLLQRTIKGSSIHIHRCSNSYIYLLSIMKNVFINKCQKITIVLGAVASCIRISSCRNIKIIAATRRIWINDTVNSEFYLLTPTRPLLTGSRNSTLYFAPYNTFYSDLEEHMEEVGLDAVLNLWDSPLCLDDNGNVIDAKYWQMLPTNDFFLFNIPFITTGKTKKNPVMLPEIYGEALQTREKEMEYWHEKVALANLSPEQQSQLHRIVQLRFEDWLQSSGHQKALDGLVSLLHHSKQYVN